MADNVSPLRPHLREPVALDRQIDGLRFELASPITVKSGGITKHGVLINNERETEVTIHTSGQIRTWVVDLVDGMHVGGLTGWHHQPLVRFRVRSHRTVRVPMLVGTACYRPALGHSIPPGEWGITATLNFAGGESSTMPVLRITLLP